MCASSCLCLLSFEVSVLLLRFTQDLRVSRDNIGIIVPYFVLYAKIRRSHAVCAKISHVDACGSRGAPLCVSAVAAWSSRYIRKVRLGAVRTVSSSPGTYIEDEEVDLVHIHLARAL